MNAPNSSTPCALLGIKAGGASDLMRTARHCSRDTATLTRFRPSRKPIPRGTSPCEDAVMENDRDGRLLPLEFVDGPDSCGLEASRGEGVTNGCDLSVVRSDDQEVAGNERA